MVPNIPAFGCFLRTFPAVAPQTCFPCAPGTSESHLRSTGSTALPPGRCFPVFPAPQANRQGKPSPRDPVGSAGSPAVPALGHGGTFVGCVSLWQCPRSAGGTRPSTPLWGRERTGTLSPRGHPESPAPLPGHSGARHSPGAAAEGSLGRWELQLRGFGPGEGVCLRGVRLLVLG